jgi:hypothetical protein
MAFFIEQDVLTQVQMVVNSLLPCVFKVKLIPTLQLDFIGSLILWHNDVKSKFPMHKLVVKLEMACASYDIPLPRLVELSGILKKRFVDLNVMSIPMHMLEEWSQLQLREWVLQRDEYRHRDLLDRQEQNQRTLLHAISMVQAEFKEQFQCLSTQLSPTGLAPNAQNSSPDAFGSPLHNASSPEHDVDNIEVTSSPKRRRLVQRMITFNPDINSGASAAADVMAHQLAFKRSLSTNATSVEASSFRKMAIGTLVERWYTWRIYELKFDSVDGRKRFRRIMTFVRILKRFFPPRIVINPCPACEGLASVNADSLRRWNSMMCDINTTVNRVVLAFLNRDDVSCIWREIEPPKKGIRSKPIGISVWTTEKRIIHVFNYKKNNVLGCDLFPSLSIVDNVDPVYL